MEGNKLESLVLKDVVLQNGHILEEVWVSYQIFGQPLNSAPIIVVNHALTGNSNVAGSKKGWWRRVISQGGTIDTNKYTVIGFNVPGNGYDNKLIHHCKLLNCHDIANFFLKTLSTLKVDKLYAVIGGSLGGGIAWEMAVQAPEFIENIIPIASAYQTSDWVIGHNYVQDKLLDDSDLGLKHARMMAMLFYRTPYSFQEKFKRNKVEDRQQFEVESWLDHHGNALESRFELSAYKLMNHLLTTIDISLNDKQGDISEVLSPLKGNVHQISIDSDLFFTAKEQLQQKKRLDELGVVNEYYEIKSQHGHDAFLIEYEQLNRILNPIFN